MKIPLDKRMMNRSQTTRAIFVIFARQRQRQLRGQGLMGAPV